MATDMETKLRRICEMKKIPYEKIEAIANTLGTSPAELMCSNLSETGVIKLASRLNESDREMLIELCEQIIDSYK